VSLLRVEPAGVGRRRTTQDQVEQTGPDLPRRVAGQVDHARHLPALSELARPPDVLVDAERVHARQTGRVGGATLRLQPNRRHVVEAFQISQLGRY
jgi:hypothetical protein